MWQANWVKSQIETDNPGLLVEIFIIKTKGDKILDVPLAKVGGKGLFVKEIEEAMLDKRIDCAVHSMKDMPAQLPEGLIIGAVPERESVFDVLISKSGRSFSELPDKAGIGTSSLRRAAQLKHARTDITIQGLRGNLDTRLKKLETEDNLDAIVLAAAGVKRLGLEEKITETLKPSTMLPAVGQGALCIETRENDPEMARLIKPLDHRETRIAVFGERAFLHRLEGSCQVPVAALASIKEEILYIEGLVADPDGTTVIKEEISGPAKASEELGILLADRLLSMGAGKILEKLKENPK